MLKSLNKFISFNLHSTAKLLKQAPFRNDKTDPREVKQLGLSVYQVAIAVYKTTPKLRGLKKQ